MCAVTAVSQLDKGILFLPLADVAMLVFDCVSVLFNYFVDYYELVVCQTVHILVDS